MDIDDVIRQLKETSGTTKYIEILRTLSDEEIKTLINREYAEQPTFIKAILYQGFKKQQAG